MAQIQTNVEESVLSVKRWLGVNEAEEGEATLKTGEASVCRNFRVTAGGALKKRRGSKTVARLMGDYSALVLEDEEEEFSVVEGPAVFTARPRAEADTLGNLSIEGDAVTVTADNWEFFTGWFIEVPGGIYALTRLEHTDGDGTADPPVPEENRLYGNPVIAVPNDADDSEVKTVWSGYVGGREVLCAVCNHNLWELTLEDGVWSQTPCGTIDTTGEVHLFGFGGLLYVLGGGEYKVWDGEVFTTVAGYRPLVSVSNTPEGGGTLLEAVNKLCGQRRAWFSPDGESTVFQLPETKIASLDWVKNNATGKKIYDFTKDRTAGTVTFDTAPEAGTNTIEIAWTVSAADRAAVAAMTRSEIFNGAQDTRVFLYGDGTNRAIYSGLDYDGNARADYFPDLNVCSVGEENTPVMAMIRHYDRLMCFKTDSAWSISYGAITLQDGTATAGFYIVPVNRDVGSCALGEARLVENQPRTLDGRSVMEWKAAGGGAFTGDQRNARRVSQRVDASIRKFDLTRAKTFYDKVTHEYYVIGESGDAVVNNVEADAWYVYTGFNARCMINYKDEIYYGDSDGNLRRFSDDYLSDDGEPIDCRWESGAMDFGRDYRRKYSAMIWIGIKPEEHGYIKVTAETDRKSDFAEYPVDRDEAGAVPEMTRIKLKAKKFTYYKLIFSNDTSDTTATVVSADVRVRNTGYVR